MRKVNREYAAGDYILALDSRAAQVHHDLICPQSRRRGDIALNVELVLTYKGKLVGISGGIEVVAVVVDLRIEYNLACIGGRDIGDG
jgi:hypothetical protein